MFLAKIEKMFRQVQLNLMDMYITVYGIHIYITEMQKLHTTDRWTETSVITGLKREIL